ncbi:hypothetical protein JK628_10580 [Shewanella sp. KX20019]|uniref:GIY-YIG nuclease family protein n=1 Tax=Shewanella sp. KX20019 TaxID=2803864 RepID=UPI0019276E3C|nr:GIY-YIG nuclease family protein [Shewanella sp. KX20019]QQX82207.1 hypothetical protein JK628_10580 [Shewanella sp. KX20019]
MLNPKHLTEAKSVGLELLRNSEKCGYKTYRFESCGHECELQVTHVRNNNFKCSVCIEHKYIEEAKRKEIRYIGDSVLGKQYRQYELRCGHLQDLKAGHVRDGRFRCTLCQHSKIENEAFISGLKIISSSQKGTNYRLFELPCGHRQEIRQDHVRDKSFCCNTCEKIELETLLLLRGLEFIEKGTNRNPNKYEFLSCGHRQTIQTHCIKSNTFRCDTCNEIKYQEEAVSAGIKLISNSDASGYKVYELSCGHRQELQTVHVRRQWFACKQCGDHWSSPNGLYLLHMVAEDGFEWLKIGTAKCIFARKATYQFKKPTDVYELNYIESKSRFVANKFEKILQHSLKEFNISSEKMKNYMGNGHTECFSTDGYTYIVSTFNCLPKVSDFEIDLGQKRTEINTNNEKRALRKKCGLIPWEHGNVIKNKSAYKMWEHLPDIHLLWLDNNKPGRVRLEKIILDTFKIKCHVNSMLCIFKEENRYRLLLEAHRYYFK